MRVTFDVSIVMRADGGTDDLDLWASDTEDAAGHAVPAGLQPNLYESRRPKAPHQVTWRLCFVFLQVSLPQRRKACSSAKLTIGAQPHEIAAMTFMLESSQTATASASVGL